MKQITVKLPSDLSAFWERKKSQLKRNVSDDSVVTNSALFQALVAFWKAMDTDSLENKDEETVLSK